MSFTPRSPRTAASVDGLSRALPALVGTPTWFATLPTRSVFTLRTTLPSGAFVARYERVGRTRAWYLYTDAPVPGQPRRVTLGPTAHLTRTRLATGLAALLTTVPTHITLPDFLAPAPNPLFPLLLTKLQVPQTRPHLQSVPATDQLSAALSVPLTLVSAPAGAGKTTLVAHWLTTTALPSAWVALDAHDADPGRIWTYIVAALDRHLPGLVPDVQPLLQSPPATWFPLVVNRCLALPAPLVLVLDDAQYLLASPSAIQEVLINFCEHLPVDLHLVLLCRQPPPWPFARWRAQGRLLEIPATALQLSRPEATRLLAEHGIAVPAPAVRHLDQQLAGWVSGWHLVAAALRRCHDRSAWIAAFTGLPTITDYFTSEVLAGLAPAPLTFLLHTSLLEELTAPACDALLETTDSQTHLDALAHAQRFVRRDDTHPQVYRVHPLFMSFLRACLQRQEPQLFPVLAARASAWYAAQGDWEAALRAADQTADTTTLAHTLTAASHAFLRRGQLGALHRWLQRLPDDVFASYPHLGVLAAYCGQGQHHPVAPAVLRALTAQHRSHMSPAEQQTLTGEILAYHALRLAMQGNIDQSAHVVPQVGAHLAPEHPLQDVLLLDLGRVYQQHGDLHRARQMVMTLRARRGSSRTMRTLSAGLLAQNAYLQGDLDTVLQLAQERRSTSFHPRADDLDILHALTWYERDDLNRAKQILAASLADGPAPPRIIALALGVQALILAAQEAHAPALQVLARALTQAELAGADTHANVVLMALRLHLQLGHTDTALALWEQTSRRTTTTANTRYRPVIQAQLDLLRGEPRAALAVLATVLSPLQEAGYQRSVLDALLTTALAHQALGQHAAARQALQQALDLAAPASWRRPFLERGVPMQRLFAVDSGALSPFGRALHWPATPSLGAVAPDRPTLVFPLVFPLTKRERTILWHLMQGSTNDDLAKQLAISVGTVKRHVSNIFLKLGVKNRTQALVQALAHHLLEEGDMDAESMLHQHQAHRLATRG